MFSLKEIRIHATQIHANSRNFTSRQELLLHAYSLNENSHKFNSRGNRK